MILRSLAAAAFVVFTVSGCNAAPTPAGEPGPALAPAARSPAGLEVVPLTISSGGKAHRFAVEVAYTPQEQATGLMNRPMLDPDRGMIFPFNPPRMASFWMKNTLIPLDMLFIRADGTISSIAANATPLSLEPIGSSEPVASVLELAGGRAAVLGIKPGDKVMLHLRQ